MPKPFEPYFLQDVSISDPDRSAHRFRLPTPYCGGRNLRQLLSAHLNLLGLSLNHCKFSAISKVNYCLGVAALCPPIRQPSGVGCGDGVALIGSNPLNRAQGYLSEAELQATGPLGTSS
jgi:hypothetical protein